MQLEQQVTSLPIAKRLKELGMKQESLYVWTGCCHTKWSVEAVDWHDSREGEWGNCHELKDQETYAAFTVAELGEMLPNYVITGKLGAIQKWTGRKYSNGDVLSGKDIGDFYADTEADARGKMMVYLLENKLLTTN